MLEYLEKFNNLPVAIKQKISSGAVLAQIEELEEKYGVPLATFIMRVMIGDLYYKNITANLIIEYGLDALKAEELEKMLEEKVFAGVMEYLDGSKSSRAKVIPEVTSPFYINKNTVASEKKEMPKVASTKPAAQSPVRNFLEDDKKDLAATGGMIASFKIMPVGKNEIMLGEIVKEANISFASADLLKRFKDILSTYLRSVRTKVEVRENLVKEVSMGGVKMRETDVDRVLAIAQKKLLTEENDFSSLPKKINARTTSDGTNFVFSEKEIKQALEARSEVKKTNMAGLGARDTDYDFTALSKKGPVALPKKSEAGSLPVVSVPPMPVLPKMDSGKNPEKAELKKQSLPPIEAKPAAVIKEAAPVAKTIEEKDVKRIAAISGNKKRMEDIKLTPKVMSPIDELAYMDLVNFRRLDQSPARRIAKIEEKINLLEREGIDKKIEGIAAWRSNPVSKTYISMGQESISDGKNIDDIIKEREAKGLNYLSKEEFEAVLDLNDNLRF